MDSLNFAQLYKQQNGNETLTPFEGDIGFSLIKLYPPQTQYYKDGRRMFIKVGLKEGSLIYSANMTNPKDRDGKKEYILTDGEEYNKKVTNYHSGGDEFSFDAGKQKVIHNKTKKEFAMDEFVQILIGNHLSDRLFWKRKLNWGVNSVLKVLFWLTDKHYEFVRVSIDKYHFSQGDKPETEEEKNIEPFFKYFYISKNLIFSLLLVSFLFAVFTAFFSEVLPLQKWWRYLFGEFLLSNPMVVLLFFLVLFTSEKISLWLNKSIKNFLIPLKGFNDPKPTFIEKLHNFQQNNKFNLKLNVRGN